MATLVETPLIEEWLFEETDEGEAPGYSEENWREDVATSRSDVISRDRSMSSVTAVVDFAKYKSAVRRILGCAYTDASKKLRRELPLFHGQQPWLYARAITNTTFLDFNGKEISDWEGAIYYATYAYAMVAVEFAEVRYELWEDDEVTYEYERYVERRSRPYTDLVQIDGGQLKAHAPSIALVDGKNYIAAPYVLFPLRKAAFDLIWHEVPRDFIEDSDGRKPKLEAMIKTVNSSAFMGYPAGTLLCEDVETVDSPSPIATDAFEGLAFTTQVTFKMKYFNPTPGDSTVAKAGWNLLPAPVATGASGATAVAWVYYTHDGTLAGKPLYDSYDFATAFTHHSV